MRWYKKESGKQNNSSTNYSSNSISMFDPSKWDIVQVAMSTINNGNLNS